jgi:hypothetical protein
MRERRERGIALVITTMAIVLLGAIGAGLVMGTTSEVQIAAAFRASQEVLYAADAAAEWAVAELSTMPDWMPVAVGEVPSRFVDGQAGGARVLADGSVVDLAAVVALNRDRRLYASGFLKDLLPPSGRPSPFYILVFVGPDASGPDWLSLRAEAFGLRASHRALEVRISRFDDGARLESWAEVR